MPRLVLMLSTYTRAHVTLLCLHHVLYVTFAGQERHTSSVERLLPLATPPGWQKRFTCTPVWNVHPLSYSQHSKEFFNGAVWVFLVAETLC
jgi:hypothetical protein